MMGIGLGVAVQLVVGVAAVVSATPLQQAEDPAALQGLFPELVQTVKELVNTDKDVQAQLLATMRDIAGTQESLQRFLMGGARVASDITAVETEVPETGLNNNMIYFTRNVVEALNSGNNTQLDAILTEMKALNDNFKTHFKSLECPQPFLLLGDECFNFQLEDLSWSESRDRCLKMGGELAIPKNLTQVRLFIGENFPRKKRRNFWLGGIENNKVWEWLSGDAVNPELWYTNEPSGNGDCLAMFDGWEHPLSDFPCENQRRAICERVKTPI